MLGDAVDLRELRDFQVLGVRTAEKYKMRFHAEVSLPLS